MRFLLDTRAYLWWLADDPRLSDPAREVIASPVSVVHVSAASLWEIAVKISLGRLEITDADLGEEIQANGFVELPISARHGWLAGRLEPPRSDPFLHLLVAQAMAEELTVVATDGRFAAHQVSLLEEM